MNNSIRKILKFPVLLAVFVFNINAVFSADEVKEQADIPAQYKWDLRSMYASKEAWEADVKKLQDKTPELVAFFDSMIDELKAALAEM